MSETKISRGQVIAAFRAFLAQRVYVSHPHPDVIRAALEMIEADGWIRVEEKLPDTDRPVLAVKQLKNGTRDICIARCIPEYQHFDAATKTTYTAPYWACGGNNNIIRWRELPEMPEEVDGDDD